MQKYKIGIFTASTPIGSFSPMRAKRAVEFLESMGHEVILGDLFYENELDYRSASPKKRAKEINNLVNQDVDILMAAIGGYNSMSVLPYLDYELIKRKDPIIVGFSDTTSILNAILTHNPKAKAVYGPSLFPNYGEFEEASKMISWDNFMKSLNHNITLERLEWVYGKPENWEVFENDRELFKRNKWKSVNAIRKPMEGIIKGGHINVLIKLLPTKYAPVFTKDDILFIEDDTKNFANVESNFNVLKLSGVFNKVKGIILGKYNHFNYKETNKKPIDLLLEALENKKIPILYDVDISHCKPMLSLPLNQKVRVHFDKKIIEVFVEWMKTNSYIDDVKVDNNIKTVNKNN